VRFRALFFCWHYSISSKFTIATFIRRIWGGFISQSARHTADKICGGFIFLYLFVRGNRGAKYNST